MLLLVCVARESTETFSGHCFMRMPDTKVPSGAPTRGYPIEKQNAEMVRTCECRQADDRMTQDVLFGQVQGPDRAGNPRKI